ncbi:MAG: hypothetical protein R3F65_14875 [bacterium]
MRSAEARAARARKGDAGGVGGGPEVGDGDAEAIVAEEVDDVVVPIAVEAAETWAWAGTAERKRASAAMPARRVIGGPRGSWAVSSGGRGISTGVPAMTRRGDEQGCGSGGR